MVKCIIVCVCVCAVLDSAHTYSQYTVYLRPTIIYGYKFLRILKIVDLAVIKYSDFAITCSIYSEIFNISGYNF